MQVSFNPYISNQQQIKQPAHKAAIQKYVKMAEKNIKDTNHVHIITLRRIMDDVFFKDISIIDAIDTFEKIKKITPNAIDFIEDYLDTLRKEL